MGRVTEPGVGAALGAGLEGEDVLAAGGALHRYAHIDASAQDLHLAEEFVLPRLPGGQVGRAGLYP